MGKDVLVTVNGEPITRTTLQLHLDSKANDGTPMTPRQALDDLINIEVLKQEAEHRGFEREPQVKAEIARHRSAILSTRLLRERYAETEISDAVLRKEYAAEVAALPKLEYHLHHIMLASKEEADKLSAALAKGADFAELAKRNSKDASAKNGGDVGWLPLNRIVPPLAGALAGMKVGELTAPLQTEQGWHLLRLDGTREVQVPPFESVREQLEKVLRQRDAQAFLNGLRARASIKVVAQEESPTK